MWAVRGGLLIHSEGPMWAVRGGLLIHSEGAYVGCERGFIDPQ